MIEKKSGVGQCLHPFQKQALTYFSIVNDILYHLNQTVNNLFNEMVNTANLRIAFEIISVFNRTIVKKNLNLMPLLFICSISSSTDSNCFILFSRLQNKYSCSTYFIIIRNQYNKIFASALFFLLKTTRHAAIGRAEIKRR